MARQIIVLERTPAGFGAINVTAVFWIPVAAGQEAPRPGFVSSVRGTDAPDAAELAALQTGTVFELVTGWQLPVSYNMAASRAFLEAAYSSAVSAFVPPGQFYGMRWDGTSWVN
jgi:hypothetical protein